MTKLELLKQIDFGERVAEQEASLEKYFVETDQWTRVSTGNISVVYGAKGSGKSAIYSLLSKKVDQLFDKNVLLIPAENPRGTPAFSNLVTNPPADESEFRYLWKIYFLSLLAETISNYGISNDESKRLMKAVEEAGLYRQRGASLESLIRTCVDYVKAWLHPKTLEGTLELDPHTGLPKGVTGKITLQEPGQKQAAQGFQSVDSFFRLANAALDKAGFACWLALDRLDTAFTENLDLEKNALRALFRVYLDFQGLNKMSLVIFLRTDIWKRISADGFREASHITKHISLTWNETLFLNLIIRRLLQNPEFVQAYNVNVKDVLADFKKQEELFYRVFPAQIEVGSRKSPTLRWILSHVADGSGSAAPREVIHLLNKAKELQIRKLEIGESPPENDELIDRFCLRDALNEVSEVRYEQTLLPENPEATLYLNQLKAAKTEQSLKSLSKIWSSSEEETLKIIYKLLDIGFFKEEKGKEQTSYWVPFLYRPALKMVQGRVEDLGEGASPDDT